METYNDRLASAAQQPLGPIPDGQAKKFEAAKDSADRSKEDNVPNGGSPIPRPASRRRYRRFAVAQSR